MKDSNSAFPFQHEHREQTRNTSEGITIRDYFAAKAMQALIARIEVNESDNTLEINASITTTSYLIADAMLKAREVK